MKQFIKIIKTDAINRKRWDNNESDSDATIREAFFMIRFRKYYDYVPLVIGIEGKNKIVMEFIDGTDLQDYLLNNPHETDLMYEKVDNIIELLKEAKIIHGDLYHLNFIINENDLGQNLYLIDFGFARFMGPTESHCDSIGWKNSKDMWMNPKYDMNMLIDPGYDMNNK